MTQDEIVAKYPELFANIGVQGSCMNFGIECGDGWLSIIEALCDSIADRGLRFSQIKEKYGALRVYMDTIDDVVDGAIRMAEAMSARTCERCGKPGQTRGKGWLYTVCDECEVLR